MSLAWRSTFANWLSGFRGALFAFLVAALLGCASFRVGGQEIVANANSSTGELSRNEARLFFTMRLQHWPDGRPVKVFVLPDDNPVHSRFAKTILGLFPYQLRRVWDRQLFSGTGQAPTTVADEDEMLRRLTTTPGAIGYLERLPRDDRVVRLRVH